MHWRDLVGAALRKLVRAIEADEPPSIKTSQAPAIAFDRADIALVNLFAVELAKRADVSFLEAMQMLSIVTANGGPDIRTPRGWLHASMILNVPGRPLAPSLH